MNRGIIELMPQRTATLTFWTLLHIGINSFCFESPLLKVLPAHALLTLEKGPRRSFAPMGFKLFQLV